MGENENTFIQNQQNVKEHIEHSILRTLNHEFQPPTMTSTGMGRGHTFEAPGAAIECGCSPDVQKGAVASSVPNADLATKRVKACDIQARWASVSIKERRDEYRAKIGGQVPTV